MDTMHKLVIVNFAWQCWPTCQPPQKVIWPTAFFLNSKHLFVQLLVGWLTGQHGDLLIVGWCGLMKSSPKYANYTIFLMFSLTLASGIYLQRITTFNKFRQHLIMNNRFTVSQQIILTISAITTFIVSFIIQFWHNVVTLHVLHRSKWELNFSMEDR